jgi:hypothetical protein
MGRAPRPEDRILDLIVGLVVGLFLCGFVAAIVSGGKMWCFWPLLVVCLILYMLARKPS